MWIAVALPLAFAIVGAIHLMPIAPVFLPETLQRLYGIAPTDTTMLVLMRHRALLLGLVGILCLWACWWVPIRPAALLAAAINVVGFLAFYALYGNPAGALQGHRHRRPDRAAVPRLCRLGDPGSLRKYCN